MTAFSTGPNSVMQDSKPGDIAHVKKSLGHFLLNTGNTDLVFLEVFRSDHFEDVSLSDWLAHIPRSMVAQCLNIVPNLVGRLPNNKPEIVPE